MGSILTFPARRLRRPVATPLFPAEVKPFPLTRYAGQVDRMARHLRSLPTSAMRSAAMVRHATDEWNRLHDLGVSEPHSDFAVVALADAVWAAVDSLERGSAWQA